MTQILKSILFMTGYIAVLLFNIILFIIKNILNGLLKVINKISNKSEKIINFIDMELEANAISCIPKVSNSHTTENPSYRIYKNIDNK